MNEDQEPSAGLPAYVIIGIVVGLLAASMFFLIGCRGAAPADDAVADGGEPIDRDEDGSARVTIGAIEWETDLDTARARAAREEKPLWLHFGENPG